jgi:prepilin peptidase CpaA
MNMMQIVIAVVGITIAAWTDVRFRKIPNWLTFSLILTGLVLNSYFNGFEGFKLSFFGLALGIFFLYIPFTVGGVGAGDVKLLGALGSLLGPTLIFQIFLASTILGGIFSVIAAIKAGAIRNVFQRIFNRVFCLVMTRSIGTKKSFGNQQLIGVPYACAIAAGTLFVLFVLKGG